jgi:hypothetical protein
MENQKNKLSMLSPQQSNPYTATPEDFEIIQDDDEIFHGQRSDKLQKQSDAECRRRPSKRSVATEASDARKSHTK